jgi:hypothetical protein
LGSAGTVEVPKEYKMAEGHTPFLRAQENGKRRTGVLTAAGRAELSGRLVRTVADREYSHIGLWTGAGWTTIIQDPDLTGLVGLTAIAGAPREKDAWEAASAEVNRIIGDDHLPLTVPPAQFDSALRLEEHGNRRTGVLDAATRMQLSGKLMPLADGEREVVQVKLWTLAGWTEYLIDPDYSSISAVIAVSGGEREKDAWKDAASEVKRVVAAGY